MNLNGKTAPTPIAEPINTDTPSLPPAEKREFLTGLGMLGWLAQTVRCDVSYAYSRIGQHSANPTTSAMKAAFEQVVLLGDYLGQVWFAG